MGFSERPERARTLAQRVADLDRRDRRARRHRPGRDRRARLGRAISLGWALAHRDRLRGVVLANTAVAPAGRRGRAVADPAGPHRRRCGTRSARPRRRSCAPPRALSRPAPARRRARRARRAVPAAPTGGGRSASSSPTSRSSPSTSAPRRWTRSPRGCRAGRRAGAAAVGPARPGVLRPLPARPARAAAARRGPPLRAGLAPGDRGRPRSAADAWRWVAEPGRRPARRASAPRSGPTGRRSGPRWRPARATRHAAVVELAGGRRTVSFDLLERRVRELAAGLAAAGVRAGDRVALLVPPARRPDGRGLRLLARRRGRRGRRRGARRRRPGAGPARRGARPRHRRRARARAGPRCCGIPGRRIVGGPRGPGAAAPARLATPPGRRRRGPAAGPRRAACPSAPDAEAAVLFTSGATGPAKGVVYRHGQLQAQLDAAARGLRHHRRRPARRGVRAVRAVRARAGHRLRGAGRPTSPRRPHRRRAGRRRRPPSTRPSSSPRPPRCATSWHRTTGSTPSHRAALGRIRLVVSAGAPVPAALLHAVRRRPARRRVHTPYGMTEALPVTDISLAEIDAAGTGQRRVRRAARCPGSTVRLSPLVADAGAPTARSPTPRASPGRSAFARAHVKDRYDQLWATEHEQLARPGVAPHRRRRAPRRRGPAVGRGPARRT